MSHASWPRTLFSGVAFLAFATAALAADRAPESSSAKTLDVIVGAGAMLRPTYIGSDHYKAMPLPVLSIKWNDMVSLGPDGLRVYWHGGPVKLGAALVFDGGRDEKDKGGFSFGSGDDRLAGMGDIDAAIGYQLFASYRLWKFDLDAAVTKYDGKQNKGLLVRYGASLPLRLTNRLMVTPQVGATWANDRYMQTFFGVSPDQALHSGFSQFDATGGTSGVFTGLKVNYALSRNWFLMGDVTNTFLMGSAKDSPLAYAPSATTVVTAIGYRF